LCRTTADASGATDGCTAAKADAKTKKAQHPVRRKNFGDRDMPAPSMTKPQSSWLDVPDFQPESHKRHLALQQPKG
jgi:hypothetical protein